MCIKKIYKYSTIGIFAALTLIRIQIMYADKVDDLTTKLATVENANNVLESTNKVLVASIKDMQDFSDSFKDDPIFEWPIVVEDYSHMTSEFGYRLLVNPYTGGNFNGDHPGIDLAGLHRARVVAAYDGEIVEYWPPPDGYYKGHAVLGGMVKIKHTVMEDGVPTIYYSVYGHMSITYDLSEYGGKRFVKAGQILGRTGNTGISFGEHLHFELRDENDTAIQSLFYLKDPNRKENE